MFKENFSHPERLSPLVLAFLGDAVYELYVRTSLVKKGVTGVNNLHQETVNLVKASSQARFLHSIEEILTEEEIKIVKRGRNTKSSVPKSAAPVDYRYSTGLEALIGYLYLKGDEGRILELLQNLTDIREEDYGGD